MYGVLIESGLSHFHTILRTSKLPTKMIATVGNLYISWVAATRFDSSCHRRDMHIICMESPNATQNSPFVQERLPSLVPGLAGGLRRPQVAVLLGEGSLWAVPWGSPEFAGPGPHLSMRTLRSLWFWGRGRGLELWMLTKSLL